MRKVLIDKLVPAKLNLNVLLKNTVVLYADTLYYFDINKNELKPYRLLCNGLHRLIFGGKNEKLI